MPPNRHRFGKQKAAPALTQQILAAAALACLVPSEAEPVTQYTSCDLSAVFNRSHLHAPFYRGEAEDFGWLKPGVLKVAVPSRRGREISVPFRILDPAGNNDKSLIVTGGRKNDFPDCFRVPIFRAGVRRVYVLGLAGGWVGPERGTPLGDVTLRFDDGSELRKMLRAGIEIDDWVRHTATGAALAVARGPGRAGPHADVLAIDVPDSQRSRVLTWLVLDDRDPAVSLTLFAVTVEEAPPPDADRRRTAAARREVARLAPVLEQRMEKSVAALRRNGFEAEATQFERTFAQLRVSLEKPGPVSPEALVAVLPRIERLADSATRLTRKRRFSRKPDPTAPTFPAPSDYMIVLNRFPLWAERGWHDGYRGDPKLGWFGQGGNGENSLRTLANFVFVYCLLATDALYDPTPSGVSRDDLLHHARAAIRYMTRTHVSGDLPCNNGKPWGNHWQSAWWTAKMAAGVQLLGDRLSPREKAAVKRVVTHEADRHLARPAPSGLRNDTKAEENAWDSEILAWASGLYPEHPHASAWERKAREFFINTLSVAADRTDATLVDGRPVRDQVYTQNVHPEFTIENHGAYHFGYMACPLHSLTWAWNAYVRTGRRPPQALFHHFRDVWNTIRHTALYNGRFAYLGGKDWARYAYGLYFVMPPLVLLGNEFGDADARLLERQRFRTFEWEQRGNGDGGFFGDRFTHDAVRGWPSEYETDAACLLALCRLMHRGRLLIAPSTPESFQQSVTGVFSSRSCEWTLARTPKAFAAFSWRTLDRVHQMGIFVPAGCDDMAEWAPDNLLGSLRIRGENLRERTVEHRERLGPVAFTTAGVIQHRIRGTVAATRSLCFAALPTHGAAVLIDFCVANRDIIVDGRAGLDFRLPNDIFNGNSRTLTWSGGHTRLRGVGGTPHKIAAVTPWLNVDGKLGLVCLGNDRLTIHDVTARNAPWASLLCERIAWDEHFGPETFRAGDRLRRLAFVLVAGDALATRACAAESRLLETVPADTSVAVAVTLPAGGPVVVVANFANRPQDVRLNCPPKLRTWMTGPETSVETGQVRVRVPPRSATVFSPAVSTEKAPLNE
ncbi:MAG: hypothetical protein GXP31_18460 [Kiritimatiellaeota bacterium]|nr:hypothetical protein [Kiritimatiellota bacterium]